MTTNKVPTPPILSLYSYFFFNERYFDELPGPRYYFNFHIITKANERLEKLLITTKKPPITLFQHQLSTF